MKRLSAFFASLLLLFTLASPALAEERTPLQAADSLHELGLFNGTGTNPDGTPVYDLDKIPSRNQAVIMLVRLLGKEQEAKAGDWEVPFVDVDPNSTSFPYIGYAYANGLTNGTSATTYSGVNPIRYNQYITFVLRALGYASGTDFTVSDAATFSDSVGLTHGEYASGAETFTRGEVAQISRNALDVGLKDGSGTLRDRLIASGAIPAPEEPEEPEKTVPAVTESGTYTTKEDVSLYLNLYGHLPGNFITKAQAQELGWTGGGLEPYAPGKCIGGDYYGNYEGLLPSGHQYRECDINTLGASKRGEERLVYSVDLPTGQNLIYYTADHYETFALLYGAE